MHSVNKTTASEFFQSTISQTANPKSADSLRQAYISFLSYLGSEIVEFSDFSDKKLRGWISWMFLNGHTRSTIAYYLKNLSSLYNRGVSEGIAGSTDIFSFLRTQLLNNSKPIYDRITDIQFFEKLQKIVRTDVSYSPELSLGKDLLLFALYNGGLTFKEISSFQKNTYEGDRDEIIEIINKYSRPKNKYLFPIGQSSKTPRQTEAYISDLIGGILRTVGLRTGNPTGETVLDLWSMTAVRCGVKPERVI